MRNAIGRVIVLVLALAIVLPSPAQADDPAPANALGLSLDQNGPWASNLSDPLFSSTELWVPGDVETAGFWAQNQSSDSTEFRVLVTPQIEELKSLGDLDVQIRADGGAWGPVSSTWSSPKPLTPGSKTHVEIRAALPISSTNISQALEFSFKVQARLTSAAPDTEPTPTPMPSPHPSPTASPTPDGGVDNDDNNKDHDSPGDLADGNLSRTGAAYPTWLLPVGFGALATGLWLALTARRRDDEVEESDLS